MNFWEKYNNNLLTIEDQKEALTNPWWSYHFAIENIPGSDIKALQAKACEEPYCAYLFARYVPDADTQYCQKHACKYPHYAYFFAKDIHNADIKYCQEHACKNPKNAYLFARDIVGADVEFCFNSCPGWTFSFICNVQTNFTNNMQMKMAQELYKLERFAFYDYEAYNKAVKKITYNKAIEKLHKLRNMRKACE